ncbi:MAG: hypothetical protein WB770_10880 [Acidimicrobiales bacterium]
MEDEPTSPIPATQSGDTEPQPAVKLPSQGGVQPPPPAPPWSPTPAASPKRIAKILGHRATGWFVAALMVGAVSGLSVALANAPSTTTRTVLRSPQVALPPNAFQVPFGGGGGAQRPFRVFANTSIGRVVSVSSSSFTMMTPTGSKLTVDEQSSTTYLMAGTTAAKNAVKKGAEVAVFGGTSGSTIKANEVFILANGQGAFFFPG